MWLRCRVDIPGFIDSEFCFESQDFHFIGYPKLELNPEGVVPDMSYQNPRIYAFATPFCYLERVRYVRIRWLRDNLRARRGPKLKMECLPSGIQNSIRSIIKQVPGGVVVIIA